MRVRGDDGGGRQKLALEKPSTVVHGIAPAPCPEDADTATHLAEKGKNVRHGEMPDMVKCQITGNL